MPSVRFWASGQTAKAPHTTGCIRASGSTPRWLVIMAAKRAGDAEATTSRSSVIRRPFSDCARAASELGSIIAGTLPATNLPADKFRHRYQGPKPKKTRSILLATDGERSDKLL